MAAPEPLSEIQGGDPAVAAGAEEPGPMTAKINRRFTERDLLLKFLSVDEVYQLHAVAVASNSDTISIRPSEGA